MKTRAIALVTAAMMTGQSIAYAHVDRTEGIGHVQIQESLAEIAKVKHELLSLDQSLLNTRTDLLEHKTSGRISSAIAITGAGAGLALSAFSYLTFSKRVEGSGVGAFLLATIATAASIISTLASMTNILLTNENQTDLLAAKTQLNTLRTQVHEHIQDETDLKRVAHLTELKLKISELSSSLSQYSSKSDRQLRDKLISTAMQVVGVAMISFGATQRNGATVIQLGAVVLSLGNIGQFLRLSHTTAALVIQEIDKTREILAQAIASL